MKWLSHQQLVLRAIACFMSGLLICTCLVGCGGGHELPTAPVRVVVTLDGKPVTKGGVQFYPTHGRHAKGSLAEDGTATLGTYKDGDGATIGQHRIAVVSVEETPSRHPGDNLPRHKWLTPQHYGTADTSGLECEIVRGKHHVVKIELFTDKAGQVVVE